MKTGNAIRNTAEQFASREDTARASFIEFCVTVQGLTEETAKKALRYYVKTRLVKFDLVTIAFKVSHGAYLDKDVLERAATLA